MTLYNSRCYILHKRPFNDRSALLDLFSPIAGTTRVVARITKQRKTQSLQQLFTPLVCAWTMKNDLGALKMIEPGNGFHALTPKTLFCGFYINELILKLIPAHESATELFNAYEHCLGQLNQNTQAALRTFEMILLEHIGQDLPLAPSNGCFDFTQQGWEPSTRDESFSDDLIQRIKQCQWDDDRVLLAAKQLNRVRISIALEHKELKSRTIFK